MSQIHGQSDTVKEQTVMGLHLFIEFTFFIFLREKCSNTLWSIKRNFKKIGQHNFLGFLKIWSTYYGSLKNLVNIFGGLRKSPDMITPVIKVNEFSPGYNTLCLHHYGNNVQNVTENIQ